MGLDMYLYCNSKALTDKVHDGEPYGEHITPFYKRRGIVMYWRKANAIHKWFVNEVQDGNDDCGTYEVDIEKLRELRYICERIIEQCPLVDGKVSCGRRFENGKWHDIIEDGKVMDNVEVAEELLPTASGFFFGSTDYDQWYYEDIRFTAEQLGVILDALEMQEGDFGWKYPAMPGEPDWEVTFSYHSSW